ncbi:MAG: phospholipid carrier-dependent glycosyltransferase [Chloroflexi bacterium]|nr:phospholipid carrier-dependent glycosyltransferase [Chloroflexota bacterium]
MFKHPFLHKRIPVVAILLLTAVYFSEIESVPFHFDESQWIASSHVFEEFFTGQFSSPVWSQSYWTLTQPPVTRYVIGFGRWVGGFSAQELIPHWQFEIDAAANIANGAMPSDRLLWWSRFPMAVLAIISILIGFMFVQKSVGRLAGITWLVLCIISPYFLAMLRRAMAESVLLACIMLTSFAGYRALELAKTEGYGRYKLFLWFGLFGAAAGLAGATKLNGVSVLAAGFVIVVIIAAKHVQFLLHQLLFAAGASMVIVLSAFGTFVGSNPFLWPAPVSRTLKMIDHRLFEIELQQTEYVDSSIDSAYERVQIVPERIFQTDAALNWKGTFLLNIAFFVIGFVTAVNGAVKWLVKKQRNPGFLVLLLVGFFTAVPMLLTPLDWDRYYLLPIFFTTVFIAVGIAWAVGEIWYFAARSILPDAL